MFFLCSRKQGLRSFFYVGIGLIKTKNIPPRTMFFVFSWRNICFNYDMLIDRADRVMNLCEMKFTQGDFTID